MNPSAKGRQPGRKAPLAVPALFEQASALQAAGMAAAAAALYRDWLAAMPRAPLAYAVWFNYAVTLSATGDDTGAEAAFRKSIALQPRFVEGRLSLGTVLERVGRPEEALDTWRAILGPAVKLDRQAGKPFYLQTLNNLGRLLELRKRYPEAEEMLRQSLLAEPRQPQVMTHWVHLRQKQCAWPIYQPLPGVSVDDMLDGASALAMLSLSDDPAQHLAAAKRFVAEKVDVDVAPLSEAGHDYGHRRLRIGYLSSDFCSHAVSILTAELYELHDRERFEVYAFSWSREDGSPIRARVVRAMDHYIQIAAMSDEQAAQCIRDHEIDILVDLHGLTLGARPQILALRPAPLQLTWLGFPGSTGMPFIDYVVSDAFLIPPELEPYFTEKPLHLPDVFQINDRQRLIGIRPLRADLALPEDAFVFCSFNNSYKIIPSVFATWMRILLRVPGSVLWLVADYPEVRDNLCAAATQAGVDPARLVFAGRALPADYLARYQVADLFLDTAPFNGGTTASDALWAGLPLLTCAGKTFSSRMAGSLLRAVDLPELVTHTLEAYEEKAVALAHDPARIAAMKRQLANNRLTCALFDSPRLVRNYETQLLRLCRPGAAGATIAAEAWTSAVAAPGAAPASGALPPPGPFTPLAPLSALAADLLDYLPADARRVVEIGCGDGAFARACRPRRPLARYTGIERVPALAEAARPHYDTLLAIDIEMATSQQWEALNGADCWVLNQVLEELHDPWALLARIRTQLAPGGQILIVMRNFQHWSVQVRLNAGDLRYQADGALPQPGLRMFTRGAMLDALLRAGLRVSGGAAVIPVEPSREKYLPALRMMAEASGIDPAVAVNDALPTHYLLVAVAA